MEQALREHIHDKIRENHKRIVQQLGDDDIVDYILVVVLSMVAFGGVYALSKTSLNLDMLFTWVIFLISVSLSWGLGFALLKKFKIGKSLKDVTWLSIYSILPMLFLCFLSNLGKC